MSDQVPEGDQVLEEPKEPAVPAVSDLESDVQPPSVPSEGITEDRIKELVEAQLEARLKTEREELKRESQSVKDRGISKNSKQINEILARLDALGGNREALIQEVDQQTLLREIENLKAQISQRSVQPVQMPSAKTAWQAEWRDESQKILDAAAKSGVKLTPEEYNGAMFNNGVPFHTKGDAYAALNQAIVRKAKGESISVAAVATEGGDVARPPAPPAEPKTAAQRFEKAKAEGNEAEMRSALNEQWDNVERMQAVELARRGLQAAGLSAEDLIEQ